MTTITIDGRTVQAAPGATVLEAALANVIDIPRLCHHPELAPSGGCRLCLVEIEGQPVPRPSCGLACADGMVVRTRSEALARPVVVSVMGMPFCCALMKALSSTEHRGTPSDGQSRDGPRRASARPLRSRSRRRASVP